jgi:GNAT superfamily N-acetyltransferase
MGHVIHKATPADSDDLYQYWKEVHPLHPLRPEVFQDRIFGHSSEQDLQVLALKRSNGRVDGIAVGVYPLQTDEGGVRWLGVQPTLVGSSEHTRLNDEICSFLAAKGAGKAVLHATPPCYIRPGVDLRETDVISALLLSGWKPERTIMNMTVDLNSWESRQAGEGASESHFRIRRAVPADHEALEIYLSSQWTENWCRETLAGFGNEPISIFLALHEELDHASIVGFSAYEVNQVDGGFGPTGVDPDHQGHGLGKDLLLACLDDLKRLGRRQCEIGWVGPVAFYHRLTGAHIGPVFWKMTRSL